MDNKDGMDTDDDPQNQSIDLGTPKEKQIPMSYLGNTLEFPRKDNVYKSKEALPYDEADSLVWRRA